MLANRFIKASIIFNALMISAMLFCFVPLPAQAVNIDDLGKYDPDYTDTKHQADIEKCEDELNGNIIKIDQQYLPAGKKEVFCVAGIGSEPADSTCHSDKTCKKDEEECVFVENTTRLTAIPLLIGRCVEIRCQNDAECKAEKKSNLVTCSKAVKYATIVQGGSPFSGFGFRECIPTCINTKSCLLNDEFPENALDRTKYCSFDCIVYDGWKTLDNKQIKSCRPVNYLKAYDTCEIQNPGTPKYPWLKGCDLAKYPSGCNESLGVECLFEETVLSAGVGGKALALDPGDETLTKEEQNKIDAAMMNAKRVCTPRDEAADDKAATEAAGASSSVSAKPAAEGDIRLVQIHIPIGELTEVSQPLVAECRTYVMQGNLADVQCLQIPWIAEYIGAAYKYGSAIGAMLAVMMTALGGIMYIASGANQKWASKGKEYILYPILGLVVIMGSYLVLYTINPRLTAMPVIEVEKVKKTEVLCCEDIPVKGCGSVITEACDQPNRTIEFVMPEKGKTVSCPAGKIQAPVVKDGNGNIVKTSLDRCTESVWMGGPCCMVPNTKSYKECESIGGKCFPLGKDVKGACDSVAEGVVEASFMFFGGGTVGLKTIGSVASKVGKVVSKAAIRCAKSKVCVLASSAVTMAMILKDLDGCTEENVGVCQPLEPKKVGNGGLCKFDEQCIEGTCCPGMESLQCWGVQVGYCSNGRAAPANMENTGGCSKNYIGEQGAKACCEEGAWCASYIGKDDTKWGACSKGLAGHACGGMEWLCAKNGLKCDKDKKVCVGGYGETAAGEAIDCNGDNDKTCLNNSQYCAIKSYVCQKNGVPVNAWADPDNWGCVSNSILTLNLGGEHCLPQRTIGELCLNGYQCLSGTCEDGYCVCHPVDLKGCGCIGLATSWQYGDKLTKNKLESLFTKAELTKIYDRKGEPNMQDLYYVLRERYEKCMEKGEYKNMVCQGSGDTSKCVPYEEYDNSGKKYAYNQYCTKNDECTTNKCSITRKPVSQIRTSPTVKQSVCICNSDQNCPSGWECRIFEDNLFTNISGNYLHEIGPYYYNPANAPRTCFPSNSALVAGSQCDFGYQCRSSRCVNHKCDCYNNNDCPMATPVCDMKNRVCIVSGVGTFCGGDPSKCLGLACVNDDEIEEKSNFKCVNSPATGCTNDASCGRRDGYTATSTCKGNKCYCNDGMWLPDDKAACDFTVERGQLYKNLLFACLTDSTCKTVAGMVGAAELAGDIWGLPTESFVEPAIIEGITAFCKSKVANRTCSKGYVCVDTVSGGVCVKKDFVNKELKTLSY